MGTWKERLLGDPLPWLLEPDAESPGVRYLTLRDLCARPGDDPEVVAACADVMRSGPVPAILEAQAPEGYWVKPHPTYSPKYRGTVWSVMFLAQLGADGRDPRIARGVEYVLVHTRAENEGFSCNGQVSMTIHCLWGNLARALWDLGWRDDLRLRASLEALARSITGEGYGWYRQGGIQGPGFVCSANYGLPCAWGAVRALWALAALPRAERSPAIEAAIAGSTEFLLGHDLTVGASRD